MKLFKNLFLLIGATAAMTACGGGGGLFGSGLSKETQAALDAIEKHGEDTKAVKNLLSAADGVDWQFVKMFTKVGGGYAVFYNPKDNKYHALNVGKYVPGMTADDFLKAGTIYSGLEKGTREYEDYTIVEESSYNSSFCPNGSDYSCSEEIDSFGNTYYEVEYERWGYVTKTETIYTDPVSKMVFEVGDVSSKDLEGVSAALEAASSEVARDYIVSNYGLSEDRASEIANLATAWSSLSKERAMTEKDMVEFQSKVFGADIGSLQKAMMKSAEGDSAAFNELLDRAAKLNDISPEQAKRILSDLL